MTREGKVLRKNEKVRHNDLNGTSAGERIELLDSATTPLPLEVIMSKAPKLLYRTPSITSGEPRATLGVEVVGTAPLIMNRFADKVVHQMLGKHMGQDTKRTNKIPREVVEQAIQRNIDGVVALPSTAFKKAMLTGATGLKALARAKTAMRISVFVDGASIPITYDEMQPRMDIVRTSGMTRQPDIRFRPMFLGWKARMVITFDEETLAATTLVDVVNRAGNVGVGEWRPEKNGDFGTFKICRILEKEESEKVRKICAPIIKPVVIPEWALDIGIDLTIAQKILASNDEATATSDDDEETDEEEVQIPTRRRRSSKSEAAE